ncbi:hypothetical protein [Peribacillus muralis]|uniref:hypothetical protein n=1 Tax=Peribacillus muralis TaxID=264697 RepID=UPI003D05A7BA
MNFSIFKRKLKPLNINLLDLHKYKIVNELQFQYEPIVLYGDEAFVLARKCVPAFYNKSDQQILSMADGYFLYENLAEDFSNTGVVCIFKGTIGTLAHELCHAKQFQDRNKWMENKKWLKVFYKLGYGFYPTEREAFGYAATYLKNSHNDKLASLYRLKFFTVILFNTRIIWPIYFVSIIKWLYHL